MSSFPQEGWICVAPFDMDHYVLDTDIVPSGIGGALCGAHGWFRGPGLREKPFDFKPTCKVCKMLLAELLDTRGKEGTSA